VHQLQGLKAIRALGVLSCGIGVVMGAGTIAASTVQEAAFIGTVAGGGEASGVLHAQAEHFLLGPSGEQKLSSRTEFWFDPQTESTRLDRKDASGAIQVRLVREGLSVTHFFDSQRYAVLQTSTDGSAPFLNAGRDQVFGFKATLAAGQAQAMADETLAGVTTTKLRMAAALDDGVDRLEVNLDKQFGLPVREVRLRTRSQGDPQVAETELIKYSRVEHVAQSLLPANTFSTAIPNGWTFSTYGALTPDTARVFRGFDIYWLGPSFGGLQLLGMSNDEAQRTTTHISSVTVTYGHPFANGVRAPGQITLVQRPPLGVTDKPAPAAPQPAGASPEVITVGGRPATLFRTEGVARVELTLAQTFVTIHGTDIAQLLEAARDLQRLN